MRVVLGAALVGLAVLVTVFLIPAAVVMGLLYFERYSDDRFVANAPVLADQLGRSDDEAESTFAETISKTFEVGSPASFLRQDLGRQGFRESTAFEGFTNALKAELTAFPCRATWTVLWREDDAGAITAVKGARVRRCL